MRTRWLASVLLLALACEGPADPPTSDAKQVQPPTPTPQPTPPPQPYTAPSYHDAAAAALAAQDPPPPKLVPLERKQYEALELQLDRGPVVVRDLPPQLSALATACPELSTFAVEVVGNVAGEVAGGTKMELPIELLSGVAEIVVENEKDTICKFVIKRVPSGGTAVPPP